MKTIISCVPRLRALELVFVVVPDPKHFQRLFNTICRGLPLLEGLSIVFDLPHYVLERQPSILLDIHTAVRLPILSTLCLQCNIVNLEDIRLLTRLRALSLLQNEADVVRGWGSSWFCPQISNMEEITFRRRKKQFYDSLLNSDADYSVL